MYLQTVYQIGDTFDLNATGEDTNGEYLTKTISAKVDSIQSHSDQRCHRSGKLSANTLNYVKSGDGINSLDEIVKSEAVNQKLVFVRYSPFVSSPVALRSKVSPIW